MKYLLSALLAIWASAVAAQNVGVRPLDDSTPYAASTQWYQNQGATGNPLMDGTAGPGSSKRWSRTDHVHPTDTSRAPLASPTFTGTPAAPTATTGTNTTQLSTTAFVNASITAGGFATTSSLSSYPLKSNNLSDLASIPSARNNLTLATATSASTITVSSSDNGRPISYTGSSNAAVVLPAGSGLVNGFSFRLRNATSAYSITLTPNGADTVDIAVIPAQQEVTLTWNASAWYVTGIRDRVLLSAQRVSAVSSFSFQVPSDYVSAEIELLDGTVSTNASISGQHSQDGGTSWVASYSGSSLIATTTGSSANSGTVFDITGTVASSATGSVNSTIRLNLGSATATFASIATSMFTSSGIGFATAQYASRSAATIGRASNIRILPSAGTMTITIRVWMLR